VETLCTKEKNHFGAAKPRQSTIQKEKLVTKQSYLHTPDTVVVPLALTCTYTWTSLNQTSYLKSSSMDSFNLKLFSKLDFHRLIKSHNKCSKQQFLISCQSASGWLALASGRLCRIPPLFLATVFASWHLWEHMLSVGRVRTAVRTPSPCGLRLIRCSDRIKTGWHSDASFAPSGRSQGKLTLTFVKLSESSLSQNLSFLEQYIAEKLRCPWKVSVQKRKCFCLPECSQ
jgi:hypothetical protein